MLDTWFNQILNTNIRVHQHNNHKFLIYKGFKLSEIDGGYKLEDVRFSEFYSKLKFKDLKIIYDNGFIKGVDIINYYRNKSSINRYNNRIVKLNNKIKKIEELDELDAVAHRRIKMYKIKISKCQKELEILTYRNKQFKIKYNNE